MQDLFEALTPGEPDWILAQDIDPARLPEHIAIIMDGNGRWANRRQLPRVAGHKAGIGPVRATVETCARLGVQVLTLYAFSIENWKRRVTRSRRSGACCAATSDRNSRTFRRTTSVSRRSAG